MQVLDLVSNFGLGARSGVGTVNKSNIMYRETNNLGQSKNAGSEEVSIQHHYSKISPFTHKSHLKVVSQ